MPQLFQSVVILSLFSHLPYLLPLSTAYRGAAVSPQSQSRLQRCTDHILTSDQPAVLEWLSLTGGALLTSHRTLYAVLQLPN